MKLANNDVKLEKYRTAQSLLNLEAQLLSNIFTAFMLVHSIFLGSLMQNVLSKDGPSLFTWNLKLFIFCILGLSLSFLWFISYMRGSSFYSLRILQSKENEPDGFEFYRECEDKFKDGKQVEVGTSTIKIGILGNLLKIKTIIIIVISAFALIYLSGIISYGFWFC